MPVLVVVLGMEPIQDVHVARPGLVVVDIAAADDATALAVQAVLAGRWATATAKRTTRIPGSPAYGCACTPTWNKRSPTAARKPGRAGRRQAPVSGGEAVGGPAVPSRCRRAWPLVAWRSRGCRGGVLCPEPCGQVRSISGW